MGTYAFGCCDSLVNVTLSNNISSLDSCIFYCCSSLASVTLPNGITSIGNGAFAGCTSLASINIPNCVISIGDEAFSNCPKITSISLPNSVTSIGDGSFNECQRLTTITLSDNLKSIGHGAFKNCFRLPLIDLPDGLETIGKYAFSHCDKLTSVEIPNSVTSIGRNAFECCDKLESITLSTGMTSIEESMFTQCPSLTSVIIPNSVISIKASAFNSCTSLTFISLPDNISSIGDGAFYQCALTSIVIPDDSIESINDQVFYSSSLKNITIPTSVTAINYEAFAGCSLELVNYKGTMSQWDSIVQDNSCLSGIPIHCSDGVFTDVDYSDVTELSVIGKIGTENWNVDHSMTYENGAATISNLSLKKGDFFKIRCDEAWTKSFGFNDVMLDFGEGMEGTIVNSGNPNYYFEVTKNGTYNLSLDLSTRILTVTGELTSALTISVTFAEGSADFTSVSLEKMRSDSSYWFADMEQTGERTWSYTFEAGEITEFNFCITAVAEGFDGKAEIIRVPGSSSPYLVTHQYHVEITGTNSAAILALTVETPVTGSSSYVGVVSTSTNCAVDDYIYI